MKEGWEIKKLGDVCDNFDSKRVPITQIKRTKGLIPYYGASGIVDYVIDYLFDEDLLCVSEDGANLLARTYPIAFSISGKTWVNNHAHVLKFNNAATQRFVEIYLNSIPLDEYISGMAQPKLNQAMLNKIPIPFPPLPEQQRIITILDECFAAIDKAKANAEQNLKNAKELFESYLQGVFENGKWEEKELRDITTLLGDGLHGTPKYTDDGDFYFINGNNLSDGLIEYKENTKRVNLDEFNKHKKNLNDRTILVSINGTLGNIAFYNGEKVILGKSACYFNLKDSVDKSFVKYVLSSPYFIKYAHREATGATIKNVSLKSMREFKVPLPSLTEQQTIVRQLDALRVETQKLEAVYQQKVADLVELKKSILERAFRGEL